MALKHADLPTAHNRLPAHQVAAVELDSHCFSMSFTAGFALLQSCALGAISSKCKVWQLQCLVIAMSGKCNLYEWYCQADASSGVCDVLTALAFAEHVCGRMDSRAGVGRADVALWTLESRPRSSGRITPSAPLLS